MISGSSSLNILALVSLLVYMAAFAIGLGPVPWLLLSEIIPVQARGKASGLSTAMNWVFAFLVTKEFSDMQVTLSLLLCCLVPKSSLIAILLLTELKLLFSSLLLF